MITAQQYAQENNLPEWIENWDEVSDLTGKTFEDISIELANALTTSVVATKPVKVATKQPAIPQPAAGSLEAIIAAAVAPYMANNTPAIDKDAVIELIKQYAPVKHIEVKTDTGTNIVTGAQHEIFEKILHWLSVGVNPYLWGPAGTGKTEAAKYAAKALNKPFYAQSVCSQTPESKLMGMIHANGGYVTTNFRKAYEFGGVFLLDEVDRGNPNVLECMNAALSGDVCAFPDGMVDRHPDFICIACANTCGTGGDRQNVSSVQLSDAFMNRFTQKFVDYDNKLECALFGKEIAEKVQAIRKQYEGKRVTISMRNTATIIKLMKIPNYTLELAIEEAITNNIPQNLRIK